MKIYTKRGDSGETGLYGGARVRKDDLRICSYGTLDELNATLGVVLASIQTLPQNVKEALSRIQRELFQLGSELATPQGRVVATALLEVHEVEALEKAIDTMEAELAPLKTFILPGGSLAASYSHVARTVARRAERELVTLHRSEPLRPVVLQYLNRLSDYLFVVARYLNHVAHIEDVPWIAP